MTNSVSSCKLMSISSIMDSPLSPPSPLTTPKKYPKVYMDRRASAPGHPYFRSPPTSPPEEEKMFELSVPSSPSSSSVSSTSQLMKRTSSVSSAAGMFFSSEDRYLEDSEDGQGNSPPLTLQERRLRNKAASAKYRQKKNQQQNEMRMMISRLSEQNAVLERQLQELRLENDRLKATTDKLRGNIVAKKMLKKWIGKQSSNDCKYNNSKKKHHPQFHPSAAEHEFNYPALLLSDQDDRLSAGMDANSQNEDDELESMISD
ncbi:hypothetical protein K501DRAFT_286571 [Backusella circina FSU 941]|nr:hypothetical protein K501DRAFT_286571 [Backusella circina FSU 941]